MILHNCGSWLSNLCMTVLLHEVLGLKASGQAVRRERGTWTGEGKDKLESKSVSLMASNSDSVGVLQVQFILFTTDSTHIWLGGWGVRVTEDPAEAREAAGPPQAHTNNVCQQMNSNIRELPAQSCVMKWFSKHKTTHLSLHFHLPNLTHCVSHPALNWK